MVALVDAGALVWVPFGKGEILWGAAEVLTCAHRHILVDTKTHIDTYSRHIRRRDGRCEVVAALLDSRSPESGQVRPIMKEAHLNSESTYEE
jgi:hypothetical protein